MRSAFVLVLVLVVGCSSPVGRPAQSPSASAPTSSVAPTPRGGLATGGVVEYAVPNPKTYPPDCPACPASLGALSLGPDGNIWYVDTQRNQVGRISPSGQIGQFVVLSPTGGAHTIAAGPDGNMWITARGNGQGQPDWIVRLSPAGAITRFAAGGSNTAPESITSGPDGNLWFTEVFGGRIGRMTPSGALTEFQSPGMAYPRGITIGPDGNLWFTFSNGVGRITTRGDIRLYTVGNDPSTPLGDIASGPDGNLWFVGPSGISHISPTTGEILAVPLPQGSRPVDLVVGPDRNIWFTDTGLNTVARLGVTGTVRQFSLPRRFSNPQGIAVGADGRIWFTESAYGRIGSIGVNVPETLLSQRVVHFGSSLPNTVTVTNRGDAALVIASVRITGVDTAFFVIASDGCSGKSLGPGIKCDIAVRTVGAVNSLRSALLQIADNATGSPQLVSLVAQLRACMLPIVVTPQNAAPQGEQLEIATGQPLYESLGGFEGGSAASGVRTTTEPVLYGQTSGYFDRAAGRWLPVPNGEAISPDGSRYAYAAFKANSMNSELHVVDVATGRDRVLPVPSGPWSVVAFGQQGIYVHVAYEGFGPGVSLVNPDTGTFKTVLSTGTVEAVSDSGAWIASRNRTDKLPGPPGISEANNTISRRDLLTGATTTWLYRPGEDLWVVAAVNGSLVVSARTWSDVKYLVVTAPNNAQPMDLPFTPESSADLGGFVGDPQGVWVGSLDGVYLWTSRSGGILVSDVPARPAGSCA